MLDFTLLDQVLNRVGDVFDWHVRVYPVLIEQVDDIDPEPLERALDKLAAEREKKGKAETLAGVTQKRIIGSLRSHQGTCFSPWSSCSSLGSSAR